MSFDFDIQQQLILDRLAEAAAAAGIEVLPDDGYIDVTDASGLAASAQVVFLDFFPNEQVARSSRHSALWAFDLYLDGARATPAQRAAGSALFSAALQGLIGWEFAPGRLIRAEKIQRSGSDGRARRRSFGFSIPVFVTD